MPLGALGFVKADLLNAEQRIRNAHKEHRDIVLNRPLPSGPAPYLKPPRNSTRWQPKGTLAIPAVPAGVDQLVFEERIALGYDGILIQLTNIWNGQGFVEAGGDITWRLKIDSRFVPYMDAIETTLGSLAIPFDIMGEGIPLLSGQLVQYFVSFAAGSEARLNNDGKTFCACSGYTWPRERRKDI